MKFKCYFFVLASVFFVQVRSNIFAEELASTQNVAQHEATPTDTATERRLRCQEFMFGAGCDGFGFGPVLSNDKKGPVYGVSAGYMYFLVDRLGASLNASAIFGSDYQQYGVGPSLTYFMGPFAGYLLTPAVGAKKIYMQGAMTYEGWSYGPSVGLMANLFGRVYWGISMGYYTFVSGGYKASEWSWSPAIFMPL